MARKKNSSLHEAALKKMIKQNILVEMHPVEILLCDLQQGNAKQNEHLFGDWDPGKSIIRIEKDDSSLRQLETFIHELCHALDDYGPFFTGHTALNAFSAALFRTLISNSMCFDPDHYSGIGKRND